MSCQPDICAIQHCLRGGDHRPGRATWRWRHIGVDITDQFWAITAAAQLLLFVAFGCPADSSDRHLDSNSSTGMMVAVVAVTAVMRGRSLQHRKRNTTAAAMIYLSNNDGIPRNMADDYI